MTEDELLALISSSPAGLRGASNQTLAAARNPLVNIEARALPAYQVPLMRAGGLDYRFPGFGIDPERAAATGDLGGVPVGGTAGANRTAAPTPSTSMPTTATVPMDLGGLSAGGSGGGGGLGTVGAGGLGLAGLAALARFAPAIARQLGLTGQEADPVGPGGVPYGDMAPVAGQMDPSGFLTTEMAAGAGAGAGAGVSGIPWASLVPGPGSLDPSGFLNIEMAAGQGFTPPQGLPAPGEISPNSLPTGAGGVFTDGFQTGGDGGTSFAPAIADDFMDFGGGIGGAAGGFGPPELGNFDFNPMAEGAWEGFPTGNLLGLPTLTAPDLGLDIGSLGFDPVSMGLNAAGTFAGTQLAAGTRRGDEQQAWASRLGGAAGAFLGGPLGAFAGSYLGGYLGAGEPDDPFWGVDAKLSYGENAPWLDLGGTFSSGGANTAGANELTNWLGQSLIQRATDFGYELNPAMVNQTAFRVGNVSRPGFNDPLYLQWGDRGNPTERADWRGTNDEAGRQGLLTAAFDTLLGREFFRRPGTGPAWQDVRQNLQDDPGKQARGTTYTALGGEGGNMGWVNPVTEMGQRTYDPTPRWSDGTAKAREGDVDGFRIGDNLDGSIRFQAGDPTQMRNEGQGPPGFQLRPMTNTDVYWWTAPEGGTQSEQQQQQPAGGGEGGGGGQAAMPNPDPEPFWGGGAARTGGMIPPTPGGTEPVPITAHTGEFVIRPEAVEKYGPEVLTAINRGTFPEMPPAGDTDMVAMKQGFPGSMGTPPYDPQEDGEAEHSPWRRPYGKETGYGSPTPFERVTSQEDPMAKLDALPPEVKGAMLASLGADPMAASAWLHVMGPEFAPMVREALKAAGAMRAQAMAMQQQAAAPMGPPAGGAPMIPGG